MNKKETEKARVLAGVEFGKWLFMRGSTMPHNTVVTKQADTMRAYGLEIDTENWESVRRYAMEYKKETEKARVLAGVEFGKWLFTRGTTMPHNVIYESAVLTKQEDTMRAYGLEINSENCESVKRYAIEFGEWLFYTRDQEA